MLANLKNAVEYVDGKTFVYDFSYNYEKKEFVIPTSGELSILINNYGYHILQVYDSTYVGFGTGQMFLQVRTLVFSLEI